MKRIFSLCLCLVLCLGFLAVPVCADFQVSYYNEEIYAGGILDLQAFVGEPDLSGYTFQWQTDASMGDNHWYDLEDNASYKGTDTNHLRMYTAYGEDYTDWNLIPFRCAVTKNGVTKYTPNIYMHIRSSDGIVTGLKNKGMGLFKPNLTNVASFSTRDDLTYTANAYAGSKIGIRCGGSSESQISTLVDSEVQLKREIKITENGKYTVSGDQTSYIPYTVGSNAVKIEVNMRIIVAGVDRGVYQTKTINLTTKKPDITAIGKAKSACSLLRYTYNESEKLASISKGTNLEIIGKEGSYYQVYYNGFVGYVGTSLVDADSNERQTIDHVELSIAEPGAGNVWPSSVTVKTTGCFATSVEWYDKTAGKYLNSGERFVKGHDYQVVIWVTAKDGYQFQLDSSNNMLTTAVLNGSLPCFTSRAYEQENGKVIDIRYDFNNVKEAEATTPTQPQTTPTQPQTTPTQSQHTHTPSDWRTTGAYHYKVCTTCGDFLEQEDHIGGSATCTQKAKCEVCGFAYGMTEPDHKWSPTYLYQDKTGHAWICADCKEHSDIEPHNPGPAATEKDPQVCKDCGYIITPAKNHTHNLTKVAMVEPTCTQEGRIAYYSCDGCSKLFEDKDGKKEISDTRDLNLPAMAHSTGDTWECDENFHWRRCSTCGELLIETQMLHEMEDGLCLTCGYKAGTEPSASTQATTGGTASVNAEESTTPSTSETQTELPSAEKQTATIGPLAAVLMGVACFIAAITTTVLVLKKKGGKK